MPLYDCIHGTIDRSSDALHASALERRRPESPDAVHLTHLTTPESIFHLRVGFASFASRPHDSRWSTWLMWPVSSLGFFIYGSSTFLAETNLLGKRKLQTWTVPRYSVQVVTNTISHTFLCLHLKWIITSFTVCSLNLVWPKMANTSYQ